MRFAEIGDAAGDLVGDGVADEELAGAGPRDGADAVAGIGAGADDRGIADPAFGLVVVAAGRSRGGEMTVGIERDGADRAVPFGLARRFERAREPALLEALERLHAPFGGEIALFDDIEPGALGESVGIGTAEHHRTVAFEQRPRRLDRVADVPDQRHRAGGEIGAAHDRGIEFVNAGGIERGAVAGVELRRNPP